MEPPQPVTLTHARLRAAQGDRRGAVRILERLIEERPADRELHTLLEAVRKGPNQRSVQPPEEVPAPRTPADAGRLAAGFRRELAADSASASPSVSPSPDERPPRNKRPTRNRSRIRRLEVWLERIRRS